MARIGLKLIMAVSADGFVASGPMDNMGWTGEEDKSLFRVLTMSSGGICGIGRNSKLSMPKVLPGRSLVTLSTRPELGMELGAFAFKFPGAWLIGGQTVALEALDIGLVEEVHLSRCTAQLGAGIEDRITPLLQARARNGQWQSAPIVTWKGWKTTLETWRRGY